MTIYNKRKSLSQNTGRTSSGNHNRVKKGNKDGTFPRNFSEVWRRIQKLMWIRTSGKSFHPLFPITNFHWFLHQIMWAKSGRFLSLIFLDIIMSDNVTIYSDPLLLKYFSCLRIVLVISKHVKTSGPWNACTCGPSEQSLRQYTVYDSTLPNIGLHMNECWP